MRFSASRTTPPVRSLRLRNSCRPGVEVLEDRCCPSSTSYTVTDLGLSPVSYGSASFINGHQNNRLGINDALQVVGMAGTGNPSVAPNHAFVWQNGVFTDLGTLGGPTSRATAINNAASPEIVGWADTTAVDSSGNYVHHACLWQQNGTGGWSITDLGALGGNSSVAYAINKSGQVVGVGNDGSSLGSNPFVWQNGVMTNLNNVVTTYAGSLFNAYGINDQGQITGGGDFGNIYPYPYRSYLLTPAAGNPGSYTVTVLPYPSVGSNTQGANAWALPVLAANMGLAINSSTQVAGVWLGYATYWPDPTKASNLGNSKVGGGGFGINSSGQVVGVFGNNSTNALNAFVTLASSTHKGTTVTAVNLNTLIPSNSGWNLIEADGINDATTALPSGSIVGYGIASDGQTHMFVAIDPPVEDGATTPAIPAGSVANAVLPHRETLSEAFPLTSLLPAAGPVAPDAGRSVVSLPSVIVSAPIAAAPRPEPASLVGGSDETVDQVFSDWQGEEAPDVGVV